MPSPSPPRQVALPDPDLDRLEAIVLQQRVNLEDCGDALQEAAEKVKQARHVVDAKPRGAGS